MGTAIKLKHLITTLTAGAVGMMVQTGFAQGGTTGVLNPIDRPGVSTTNTDLRSGVVSLVNYFLGFLGLVAVIVIVAAGVKLVASQGNDAKVKEAQKTILYAALGLLIVFFAYAIVTFVVNVVA